MFTSLIEIEFQKNMLVFCFLIYSRAVGESCDQYHDSCDCAYSHGWSKCQPDSILDLVYIPNQNVTYTISENCPRYVTNSESGKIMKFEFVNGSFEYYKHQLLILPHEDFVIDNDGRVIYLSDFYTERLDSHYVRIN